MKRAALRVKNAVMMLIVCLVLVSAVGLAIAMKGRHVAEKGWAVRMRDTFAVRTRRPLVRKAISVARMTMGRIVVSRIACGL